MKFKSYILAVISILFSTSLVAGELANVDSFSLTNNQKLCAVSKAIEFAMENVEVKIKRIKARDAKGEAYKLTAQYQIDKVADDLVDAYSSEVLLALDAIAHEFVLQCSYLRSYPDWAKATRSKPYLKTDVEKMCDKFFGKLTNAELDEKFKIASENLTSNATAASSIVNTLLQCKTSMSGQVTTEWKEAKRTVRCYCKYLNNKANGKAKIWSEEDSAGWTRSESAGPTCNQLYGPPNHLEAYYQNALINRIHILENVRLESEKTGDWHGQYYDDVFQCFAKDADGNKLIPERQLLPPTVW